MPSFKFIRSIVKKGSSSLSSESNISSDEAVDVPSISPAHEPSAGPSFVFPRSSDFETSEFDDDSDNPFRAPLTSNDAGDHETPRNIRAFHTMITLLSRLQKRSLTVDTPQVATPKYPVCDSENELKVLEALATILVLENDVVAVVANEAYCSKIEVIAVSQVSQEHINNLSDDAQATHNHSGASGLPSAASSSPPPLTKLVDGVLRFLVGSNPRTRVTVMNDIPIIVEPGIPVDFDLVEWKALKNKAREGLSEREVQKLLQKKQKLVSDYGRKVSTLGPHTWILAELLMQKEPWDDLLAYVLSACCKKIRHRLMSKLSESYFNTLLSLSDKLKSPFRFPFQIPAFSKERSKGQKENDLLLLQSFERLKLRSHIPNLKERAAKVLNKQPINLVDVPPLYDKDTYIEFHEVLCELLLSYKKAIDALSVLRIESDDKNEEFGIHLARAKAFGYALEQILKGSAISCHFEMLRSLLDDHRRQAVPVKEEEEDVDLSDVQERGDTQQHPLWKSYVNWLALMVVHFDAVHTLVRYVTRARGHKSISIKHLVPPNTEFDCLPLEELLADERIFPKHTDGALVTNKELVTFLVAATSPSTEALASIKTFKEAVDHGYQSESYNWVNLGECAKKLAVDGYDGLPGWETHVPEIQSTIDKYARSKPQTGARFLKFAMKQAAKQASEEQDKSILSLTPKINFCLESATLFNELHFSNETQVEARLHCEAYLVSLLKRPKNLGAPYADLMNQLKEFRRVIGISKRCCPVCYHLISFLNKKEPEFPFVIKGFHNTITPCALPPWLPAEIVDDMNNVFGSELRKGLVNVYNNYSRSNDAMVRQRVPSTGSQAASLQSNESGPGVDALKLYVPDVPDHS